MTMDQAGTNEDVQAPGQPDDDGVDQQQLVKEITDNLRQAKRHFSLWRLNAREDYDFFAGIQWSEEDKLKLDEEERPAVTFNRIARTINAVAGLELQNRQEVKFIPQQMISTPDQNGLTSAGFSEVLTNAAKWVREQCDAEDEESEAFQDALICGVGWTETRMDYDEDQEGNIVIDRIDPMEMLVDPEARKRNFSDAKWVARIKNYTIQQVKEMFPDLQSSDLLPESFWTDSDIIPHDADPEYFYTKDQSERVAKLNTISVIQYQYYTKENSYHVQSQTGNVVQLDDERFQKLQPFIKQNNLKYVQLPKRVYMQCFLIGSVIVDQEELGCDHFTFRGITGLRDRNRNTWFGLVSLMKDPQRWANKWMSQIQHIINTNAKGGAFIEQGALANRNKAEKDWARPDAIIDVTPGTLQQGKIMPREAPRYPEGVDRLLQYALQSINDVPGVNLELIGLADRDQANVLEQSRKQAGITILASFFDALRRYRKVQGRVLAYYIREYISDGRLIRILGPTGSRYIPLIKDEVSFKYDIIVDDSPTSPNMKERVFNTVIQVLPMLLQAGIPVPPDLVDYMPIPDDLQQKWKALIVNGQNDPMNQKMKQTQMMNAMLDVQEKSAKIDKHEADSNLANAKAQQAQANSQDQSALAMQRVDTMNQEHQANMHMMQQAHQANMNIMQNQNQIDQSNMMRDAARKDTEMLLNQRRKAVESAINMHIKAKQAAQKPIAPSPRTVQ